MPTRTLFYTTTRINLHSVSHDSTAALAAIAICLESGSKRFVPYVADVRLFELATSTAGAVTFPSARRRASHLTCCSPHAELLSITIADGSA